MKEIPKDGEKDESMVIQWLLEFQEKMENVKDDWDIKRRWIKKSYMIESADSLSIKGLLIETKPVDAKYIHSKLSEISCDVSLEEIEKRKSH